SMRHLSSLLLIALLAQAALGWRSNYEIRQEEEKDKFRAGLNAASGIINQAAGVFMQVNTAGEPIFKHVSGGTWGMRQINTAGQAIYKPSLFGSAFSGLGKVAWWGAAAAEAVNVLDAAGKDRQEGGIKNTARASTKAVGSWTGAAYGASAGAAALSFIPGVGTLVGGIAGGLFGAYAGSAVGEVAAEVVVGPPKSHSGW
ncbi:hypothetical protein PMAYCL1PPCAC_26970, partial [Pristionchus mayeri]